MKLQFGKIFLFYAAAATLALAACIPLKVQDKTDTAKGTSTSTYSAGPVSSVAAFKASVYPIVTTRCNSCHVSTNPPFFAGASEQLDHDAIVSTGKVSLDSPATSRLVLRLSQDMHNCWGNCAANAAEMQAAIVKWKSLLTPVVTTTGTATSTVVVTAPAARVNTIEMPLPAVLPGPGEAAANFATMTWTLASNADTIVPDVAGASFRLEVQKFDNFSYRVRNPRVVSPTSAVYVSDFRVSVNGIIRANDTTFSLVDQIVAAGATGTVLSPASMVMLMDKGTAVDKLALSFVQMKAAAASGCKNLAGWQTMVKPGFTASCIRCHNAGSTFDMTTGTDANICARTLGRVDLSFPSNSPLVVKPLTGTFHPGGGNLINQTTANSWVNWITSER